MSTGQNQIVKVKWADGFSREFTFARPEDALHFARALLLGSAEMAALATRVNEIWESHRAAEWFPETEGTHFVGKPL